MKVIVVSFYVTSNHTLFRGLLLLPHRYTMVSHKTLHSMSWMLLCCLMSLSWVQGKVVVCLALGSP